MSKLVMQPNWIGRARDFSAGPLGARSMREISRPAHWALGAGAGSGKLVSAQVIASLRGDALTLNSCH